MSLDLRSDHLAIVQKILNRFVPKYRVIAFGSRVTEKANKTSDLDLCIISDDYISFEILGHLREEFSISDLPYKVDLIDWMRITPDFQKIILENCFDIQSDSLSSDTKADPKLRYTEII